MNKKVVATALALCMCTAFIPNAHALEGRSAGGAPAAAETVWSDADPRFMNATPETTAGVTAHTFAMARAGENYPTFDEAYQKMIALQSEYPEGTTWTNYEPYGINGKLGENYRFKGGAIKGAQYGVGCAAFCFLLSDAIFGTLPAYVYDHGEFTFDDIRVGDFLRVNSARGGHFVTVLRITSSGVILTEGNYNGTVHWGRAISKDQLMFSATFLVTRYPKNYSEDGVTEAIVEQGQEPGKAGTLNWTISNKGVLTITGSGAMKDYDRNDNEKPSWETAAHPVYSVDIGSGITSVGAYAFYQNTDLVRASLPSTIVSIGASAFYGSNIIGIAIPASVKSVGNDAFRSCTSLTSIDIAEGVETIGERAFHSCTALGYVDLPSSLTSLGAGAFTSCEQLAQVRFMPSSKSLKIGSGTFTSCWNLNYVSLPEGIKELPQNVFSSCKTIYYIYIPSTVTTLGEAGEASPFLSSYIGTVYFGGKQAEWDTMMARLERIPSLKESTYLVLSRATVVCEQNDPFVPDVNDPGDIHFCENGEHIGPVEDNGICQNCGEAVTHTHSWAEAWEHDDHHHWHECTAPGCDITSNEGKDGYDAHLFDGDTDTTCNTCGHIRTISDPGTDPTGHEHDWAEEWNKDTAYHWHDCTASGCPVTDNSPKDGFAAHVYDDDTDDTCNTCGYTRTIPEPTPSHDHKWGTSWSKDDSHHWHECTSPDCDVTSTDQKAGYDEHVFDGDTDTTCDTCGYIRTDPDPGTDPEPGPTPSHTHSWTAWNSDGSHHWHECTAPGCDITSNVDKDGYAAHVFDSETDTTCDTCGYVRTLSGNGPSSSGSDRPSSSSSGGSSSSGSTTSTTTKNPDGSTTTKTENKNTGTTTETTKNTDGSQTVVETKKDGTVTTTETDRSGNKTETVEKPDGSRVTNINQKDGTAVSIITNASGQTEAEVTLPAAAVSQAQHSGETISLPIPKVQAVRDTARASTVTVKTGSKETVNVNIPAENVTPGTVAVIVSANGREEAVKLSVPTENGIAVPLPDGATVKIVDNSKDFADISASHWANDAVDFVSARELFSGTGASVFDPGAPMTRAMLMTVLARCDGEDTSGGTVWYEKGMVWAVAKAISDGSDPNGDITREQLATMLWRYSGSPASSGKLDTFTDVEEVSGYAQEAIHWAVENGILSGYGNGQLVPKGHATRAETAVMLMRFISNA